MFEQCSTPLSVHDLYACIEARRQERQLGQDHSMWSLCELGVSTQDYEILCEWWKSLLPDNQMMHESLYGATFTERTKQFGAVLLLFVAETARREATGALWAILQPIFYERNSAVTEILFRETVPTEEFKKLMRRVAESLNLRRIGNKEEGKWWFSLIMLQIGITKPSLETYLPQWLAGYFSTRAIVDLRSTEVLQSTSFRQLWEQLERFRYNEGVNADQLRAFLNNSPWVMNGLTESILQAAKRNIRLQRVQQLQILGNYPVQNFDEEEIELPKLVSTITVRVQGNQHQPHFVCVLQPKFSHEMLESEEYTLYVRFGQFVPRRISRFLRHHDGTYQAENLPQQEITVQLAELVSDPASGRTLLPTLHIVSKQGKSVYSEVIELWNDEDLPEIYNVTLSRKVTPKDVLQQNHSFVFILPADLDREELQKCLGDTFSSFDVGDKCIGVVQSGWENLSIPELDWSASARPLLPSEWTLEKWFTMDKRFHQENPYYLHVLTNRNVQSGGSYVYIQCSLPDNVSLRWIRVGKRGERQKPLDDVIRFLPYPHVLHHQGLGEPAQIDLIMRINWQEQNQQRSATLTIRKELFVEGIVWKGSTGEHLRSPKSELSIREAQTLQAKIFLPASSSLFLLEGRQPIRKIAANGKLKFSGLVGYGQPLVIGPRFNAPKPALRIAERTFDQGIIRSMEFEDCNEYPDDNRWYCYLTLENDIEPDDDYRLLCWTTDGIVHEQKPRRVERNGQYCWTTVEPLHHELMVIAIFYKEHCMGAYWDGEWSKMALQVYGGQTDTEQIYELAALLRLFKLPILSEQYLLDMRTILYKHPYIVFRVWTATSEEEWTEIVGNIPSLQSIRTICPPMTTAWNNAIRVMFRMWLGENITIEEIQKLFRTTELSYTDSEFPQKAIQRMEPMLHIFIPIDPTLLARFLRKLLLDIGEKDNVISKVIKLKERELYKLNREKKPKKVIKECEDKIERLKKEQGEAVGIVHQVANEILRVIVRADNSAMPEENKNHDKGTLLRNAAASIGENEQFIQTVIEDAILSFTNRSELDKNDEKYLRRGNIASCINVPAFNRLLMLHLFEIPHTLSPKP